jgi:hypothetical protein
LATATLQGFANGSLHNATKTITIHKKHNLPQMRELWTHKNLVNLKPDIRVRNFCGIECAMENNLCDMGTSDLGKENRDATTFNFESIHDESLEDVLCTKP